MRRVKLIAFRTCLILQRRRQEFWAGGTKLDFDSRVELPMIIGENGKKVISTAVGQTFSRMFRFQVYSVFPSTMILIQGPNNTDNSNNFGAMSSIVSVLQTTFQL